MEDVIDRHALSDKSRRNCDDLLVAPRQVKADAELSLIVPDDGLLERRSGGISTNTYLSSFWG
jgi:hypothetical protein